MEGWNFKPKRLKDTKSKSRNFCLPMMKQILAPEAAGISFTESGKTTSEGT